MNYTLTLGFDFRCGRGVDSVGDAGGCVKRHFAFAAIAALRAFLADMVVARVFGAPDANPRGRLIANAALEWHRMAIFSSAAGWARSTRRGNVAPRCPSLGVAVPDRRRD